MWRRLRLLSIAIVLAAVSLLAIPRAALADGGTAIGIPTFEARNSYDLKLTCGGGGFASWSGSGYTEIGFGGATQCSGLAVISGTAELIRDGGAAPVATVSFAPEFATYSGSAQDYFTAPQGSGFFIRYTTTVRARPGFQWETVPAPCTVSEQFITCSVIRPFVAN
jgi:hypothetical protein